MMATTTNTTTESTAYTAVRHLQNLTKKISTTIHVLITKGYGAYDGDLDEVMTGINIFILNDCITSIAAELYDPRTMELIQAYEFNLSKTPVVEHGPSAANPPLPITRIPHANLRIIVEPVDDSEYTLSWFERLGWESVEELREYGGARTEEYGTFSEGGFGVTRRIRIAKKYDVASKD